MINYYFYYYQILLSWFKKRKIANVLLFSETYKYHKKTPQIQVWLFSFTVDKRDQDESLSIDLSVHLSIEDRRTDFILLSDATIPIPLCDRNTEFRLPGDGTVASFVLAVGDTIGQSAVEAVMKHLDIEEHLSSRTCTVPHIGQYNLGETPRFIVFFHTKWSWS